MAAAQEATKKLLWLDCDPGHDDAIALLMALYDPHIQLVGVSTVHGNASLENTTINAARCLHAFGAPPQLRVRPGTSKPFIGPPHPAVDIHGNDGLGGVEGLPDGEDHQVKQRIISAAAPDNEDEEHALLGRTSFAVEGLRDAALQALGQGRKLYLGVTGACTNAALFILAYPELARRAVEKIVCMGGGVGIGNITAMAEFNIYIDPEAASIVLESGIPCFFIPLNVTHQLIFHRDAQRHLLDPSATTNPGSLLGEEEGDMPLPKAVTPLRHTLSTLITFFSQTYREVFGFQHGPPIHDALVVAYVAMPQAFKSQPCHIDIERGGNASRGALVVDPYDREVQRPKNAEIALNVEVETVLRAFFSAVNEADAKSPLNETLGNLPRHHSEPPTKAIRAIH